MSVRKCPRCGRQIPANYQQCPYCARQKREKRRQPASPVEQSAAALRENNTRFFVGGAAFFLCLAILGSILTQCSNKNDTPKVPDKPAAIQTVWLPLGLTQNTAALNVGDTITLTPTGSFDTLFWTSTDESIATVNNGKVTGRGAGIVTITASTGIGSASCTVTVAAPIPTSRFDLALNHTDITISSQNPTAQLKLRIKGTRDEYEGEIVWASQDVTVATVSETGLVERVGKGRTIITATADGQTLECIVRMK